MEEDQQTVFAGCSREEQAWAEEPGYRSGQTTGRRPARGCGRCAGRRVKVATPHSGRSRREMVLVLAVDVDDDPEICDMRVGKVDGDRLIGERQLEFTAIQG